MSHSTTLWTATVTYHVTKIGFWNFNEYKHNIKHDMTYLRLQSKDMWDSEPNEDNLLALHISSKYQISILASGLNIFFTDVKYFCNGTNNVRLIRFFICVGPKIRRRSKSK